MSEPLFTDADLTLEIESPLATCGHCRFTSALSGTWSVEDGRLVFRANLNPLANRGPGMDTCCESRLVPEFRHITVDGERLTGEQTAVLQASARSDAALREELGSLP